MAFDGALFGEYQPQLAATARRLDTSFALGLRPPPRLSVSEWAAKHRRFADDAPYPGRWRHEQAPYLVEIMDALSPHDPCEEVDAIKCGQSGGTASAENWIGFISDVAPGPMLFAQATLKAALDWAAEKFWPMVESTPRLSSQLEGTIEPLGKADGDGSTKGKIKFRRSNGYVLLAGGNSAASLRQRTVRYAVEDDLDQMPDDVDGQGSPEVMIDKRLTVYRRQGLSKRLKISTPTIKGASKIGTAYETSERRRFYMVCPGCADRFDLVWEDITWPDGKPEEAYVKAPCCGSVLEHWQKSGMEQPDGWASVQIGDDTAPRVMSEADFQAWRARMPQSRKRGFHITGEMTSFQTWGDMASNFVACRGDLNKLRAWTNLDRGELFELKGSTPDYEKLKGLREQHWARGQLPVGPVCTTMGVDVQGDGLYYEKLAWGENAENWSFDVGFLPGQTDVAGEGAWVDLDKVALQLVTYPGGRAFPIDQVCVDAGYHTAAAEAFCRSRPNRLPVFGRAGWTLPVIGRGENLRYERQGRKAGSATKRTEDKAYLVGTYGVKLTFYGYLRSTLRAAAEEAATTVEASVRGRCHFNRDAPDQWFEQVTAETIVVKVSNGYPKRVWEPMPGRENHWLDCRVYNHAAAEKLMLDTLTEADWARLRADRCGQKDPAQGDLLDLAARPAGAPAQPAPAAPTERPTAVPFIDAGEDYLT